jgi:uncharacterized integral membrane protein
MEKLSKKKEKIGWKIYVTAAFILIILLALSVANTFGPTMWTSVFSIVNSLLELLYFVSGILLLVGLFIGYNQLKTANEDIKIRNERLGVEKSLDYLSFFAHTLVPKMSEYVSSAPKGESLQFGTWDPKETDYKLEIKNLEDSVQLEAYVSLLSKQERGVNDIFNHLEFFSAGVVHGLADEEVVYNPISKMFCRFVEREIIYLSTARSEGTPFANVTFLYKKWSLRLENDTQLLKIRELESTIEETLAEVTAKKQAVEAGKEITKPQKTIGS